MDALRGPWEIAPRVWWVGAMLPGDRFQCHVYLVEQGDQSVLIDPGSALTADAVIRNVEQVVGLASVRWLVCSHSDPDIVAAVPALLAEGISPQAAVVTHWRDEALMRHLGWPLPFHRIEEHDWRLELEDRAVRFVFTPYAHFAGAFCTFDEATGTLFSSDLFGAFTDDAPLIADLDASLDGMREFHEHYMPSNEALVHSVNQLRDLPIRCIAPQHGQVLPAALVPRVLDEVASWDCGLYLDAKADPGLAFLFTAHRTVHDLAQVLLEEPDFPDVASHLQQLAAELLGAEAVELWARAGEYVLVFDRRGGYCGHRGTAPADVLAVLGGAPGSDAGDERLLVPLVAPGSPAVAGVAVLELSAPVVLDVRAKRLLADVAALVATAVGREVARTIALLDRAALHDQAVRDGLTGLHNRFHLSDVLPKMLAGHDRDGRPVSVLMVDVDQFKRVNDDHGHLVGDAVLRHIATALDQVSRIDDLTIRYGGDEFLVVLAGVHASAAQAIAGRLREAIAATPEGLPAVTVSVGVAEHRPREPYEHLLERADRALYEAKGAGRDRAHVAA
ncbi:MAG: diguanylate cyclase [Acidimicrobiales bacterium]